MAKTLRAIALQTKIELESYRNRASFEAFLKAEMERAKPQLSEEYPNLVVFPEDIGTPLVTLGSFNAVKDCRTLDEAVAAISKRSMDYVLVSRIRHRAGGTQAVILSKEPIIRKTYEEVFSSLSQEYNAYILAGTAVLPPERQVPTAAASDPLQVLKSVREATKKTKLYNTAHLFGPNGDILLRQRKVNLIPLEKEEGLSLSPGNLEGLQPYTIEGIPIGVTICYDAFFPEIVRYLADSGAKILVDPSANPEPWTEEENRKGLYARVQEEAGVKYGIQAMLTGKIFNLTFEGKSSIVTKKENTPDMTGIVCQANNHYEPDVIAADLAI
jgi:predicted amidohydrolase